MPPEPDARDRLGQRSARRAERQTSPSWLTVRRERPLSGSLFDTFADESWPARDLRLMGSNPGFRTTDVSLRSPTWPQIPRKFTRPSHLGPAIASNRLFLRSGSASRVGSIPIARSTLSHRPTPVRGQRQLSANTIGHKGEPFTSTDSSLMGDLERH